MKNTKSEIKSLPRMKPTGFVNQFFQKSREENSHLIGTLRVNKEHSPPCFLRLAYCYCCQVTSVVSDSVWPHRRSPPASPVPGILQARTLEWVAISISNAWRWKLKRKSISPVGLLAIPRTAAYQAPPSRGVSRQESWSGAPFLLHGVQEH